MTSDAGLLVYRELDDALGLTPAAGDLLADARTGKNGRHALVGMFRQAIFGRLAGHEDVNDALRLRHDPAMRWIIGGQATKRSGASPSQMGRFETNWLARPENLVTLTNLSGHWIDRVAKRRSRRVVLDMDSTVSPTHGDQEGSVWNGHSFAPAIIRCLSSINMATWNVARFAPATYTAPMDGKRFSNQSSHGTRVRRKASHSEATLLSLNRACTSTSNQRASNMRSASRQIRFS